jgi:hypothetical protein
MKGFYVAGAVLVLFMITCFFIPEKENIKTIDEKNVYPCDVYLDKQIKYTIKNVKNIKIDTLNKHQLINIDTNETYTLYEYTITFEID